MKKLADRELSQTLCKSGHQWGEWKYVAENSCTMEIVCSKCNVTRLGSRHVWEKWKYIGEISCEQIRSCRWCEKKEARVEHDWIVIDKEEETTRGYEKGPGPSFDAERYEVETVVTTIYYQCSHCKEKKTDQSSSSTRID